jgi:TatA/E family protein of Tat protein translocase
VGIENPVHLLFVAVVALVVLGPKRLPGLAKALGQGIREFREALSDGGRSPVEPAASEQPVDPTEPLRSGDALDRGPL